MPDPIILALTLLWLWDMALSVLYVAGLVFLYQRVKGD